MMSNDVSHVSGMKEISSPRFAAFYNWLMGLPLVRRGFDPLRREIVGQAQGVVLEVGAGGGQNFPFYDPTRVVRVEAVEPDEAMLVEARRALSVAPVPIALTRASVEALPFPDAQFDSAVVTLVFCSVQDPERGLREVWRVLKPGGTFLLLEHVRAQGKMVAWVQDALVPLSTRCMGHCHWNRDTLRMVLHTGFQTTQVRQLSGGSSPCCWCMRCVPKRQRRPMKASDTASPQGRGSGIHREEVIIVGAGQAGLSMGYWLKRKSRSFLLLEAGPRLGESWRQRYDSLVLFTPRRYSALPGLAFPGDPEGRPTKD